jgi:hypothetical protein
MIKFKVGDHVKMSEIGKAKFRGKCGEVGYHIDPDYPRLHSCMIFSS